MSRFDPIGTFEYVEQQLQYALWQLEKVMDLDVASYLGPILPGVDEIFRRTIKDFDKKRNGLAIVLETDGGMIQTVERLVHIIRHHYEHVVFVVPDRAMSAGTVFVLSGDAIYMDYYSVLGPIDPQVSGRDGKLVPALGYWKQYQKLLERAKDPDDPITPTEVNLLIDGFDQAELYSYEMARELSVDLLKEWLVKYKFKDWTETETRREPVTAEMKRARAEEIANMLNDTDKWYSHGRGISMQVLRRDLKLRIDDFEEDPKLSKAVRKYYDLLVDYRWKRGHQAVIHSSIGYASLFDSLFGG